MMESGTSRRKSRVPMRAALAMLALVLCAVPTALAQDRTSKLEEEYRLAKDPVRKARALAKLGPLKIERAHSYLKADDEEQALATLEQYRDEVRKTSDALAATNVNAQKRPGGFKELQIGLRQSIRRLDQLIVLVPEDKRPWFEAVRSDLSATQNSLIEALFPTVVKNS